MSHHHTLPRHRIKRSFKPGPISTNIDEAIPKRRRYLGNPMRLKRKSPKAACLQMTAMFTICFIYFYFTNTTSTKCSLQDPMCPNLYFSDTYNEARDKFLTFSSKIRDSKTYSLPIVEMETETLYTDITVINGNAKNSQHLIVHISGVHGVEGYIGSAVQCAILSKMAQAQIPITKTGKYQRKLMESRLVNEKNKKWINDSDEFPVVVFVHALNPFGMFYSRIINENNVDLNMNLWQDDDHKKHDEELDDFLHPKYNIQHLVDNVDRFVPGARFFKLNWIIHRLYTYLINWHLKTQIYSFFANNEISKIFERYGVAQSYNKNGLQFVGYEEKEKSHRVLMEFLQNQMELQRFEKVTLIDVHSGDGDTAYGKNTIRVADEGNLEIVQNIARKVRCSSLLKANVNMNMNRMMSQKYLQLTAKSQDALGIIQNFGTYSMDYMLNVIRFEHSYNMEYNQYLTKMDHDDETLKLMKYMKQYSSKKLLEAYYVKDIVWRRKVIVNGYDVFRSLYAR